MSKRLIIVLLCVAVNLVGCTGSGESRRASVPRGPSTGGSQFCTAIGCTSGATIDFTALWQVPGDEVNTATACIDGHCNTTARQGDDHLVAAFAVMPYDHDQAVTVSIMLRDAAGRILASDQIHTEVRRTQPNGVNCAPVCYSVYLNLDANGKLHAVP